MKKINFLIWVFISALMLTACNKDNPNEEAYNNADIINGGIMYDKLWASESDFDQNSPHLATLKEFSNFFRCKQCHGWDGLGNQGAYISRAPKTTRPNVTPINLFQMAQTESADELFEELKETSGRRDISYDLSTYDPESNNSEGDKMPNLNQILTDSQIWDLIKFLKEGMLDVSQLYDASYSGSYPNGSMVISNLGKDGNGGNGKSYYAANCALCHGANGTALDLEGMTLGKFTRTKPNEVQHKIMFGQPGSIMMAIPDITLEEVRDLYKALADTQAFPD